MLFAGDGGKSDGAGGELAGGVGKPWILVELLVSGADETFEVETDAGADADADAEE